MRRVVLTLVVLALAPFAPAQPVNTDIAITATLTPSAPAAGQRVTVQLRVRNNGPELAQQVGVRFESPDGLVILSASGTNQFQCDETPRVGLVRCTNGVIPVGTEAIITAVVVAPNRTDVPWTAVAAAGFGQEFDLDPSNNPQNLSVTLGSAPLADLNTKITGATLVPRGGTAELTYEVRNEGPTATGPVYAGFTLFGLQSNVTASGNGWTCVNRASTVLYCTKPSLAAGETSTIEFDAPTPSSGDFDASLHVRTYAENIADPDPTDNVAVHDFQTGVAGWEPILIPITRETAPGAFGSLWKTETRMLWNSDATPDIRPVSCGRSVCYERRVTFNPYEAGVITSPAQLEGGLVYVPTGASSNLRVNTRVHNTARDVEIFGTEIPAVRTSQLTPIERSTVLLNVPIDPRFRHTLRIYDVDAVPNRRVTIFVHVMGERTYRGFFQRTFEVPDGNGGGPNGLPLRPGYIQVSSDEVLQRANLTGAERIYYSIAPNDSTARLWAFVAVTNNTTNEFTTITP